MSTPTNLALLKSVYIRYRRDVDDKLVWLEPPIIGRPETTPAI